jgi:aldose 1-epimerase
MKSKKEIDIMEISKKLFGKTKAGDEVIQYTLTNENGANVSILNLGGIIREINVPDQNGTLKNVAVSYDDVEKYESYGGYIGAMIGRVGGRISNAAFDIDGTSYTLAKNDGNNNLHGGHVGFDKILWEVSEYCSDEKASLTLHHMSPDMTEGFPGNLDCNVTYSFDNKNALSIQYTCTTDKKTFVNLTNHCYFNLSGDYSTTIHDHELTILANQYTPVNAETIATGIEPVQGTVFDFREGKAIGKNIHDEVTQLLLPGGYDHAFELNQPSSTPLMIAKDPKTGRTMEISTDAACVVFYSGNHLDDSFIASGGIPLQKQAAFCLETQYYPDAINAPFVKSVFLEPEQVYRTKTTYTFK